jgi:hypothetical protein
MVAHSETTSLARATVPNDATFATDAAPKRKHLQIVCMPSSPLPTNEIEVVAG